MRKALSLFWLLIGGTIAPVVAQKPLEVVILASSHYNGDDTAAYRPLISKLKAYRPDMVFGEYLSAADVRQLPAGQPVAVAYQRRRQYLRRQQLTTAPLTASAAATARRQLRKKPLRHQQRIDLARFYALGDDRGNAEYQLYLLEEPFKSSLSPAERAYYSQAFGPADSLRKTARLVRPLSEYHKIIFPLLRTLGQEQLYPMDCQRYDDAWNKASQETYTQFMALKASFLADSTTPQAATYRQIRSARPAYFAEINKVETTEAVYHLLNSPAFEQLDNALNFYGGEALYDAPGSLTVAVRAMKEQWVLRNQGMCDNIVRQARAQNARRVLVAVGSSHGQEMRRLLARMPNVRVRTYNDLP